jgi:hypothetical protein
LNVGDFLGHLPLPSKLTTQVLPPIDVRRDLGRRPNRRQVHDHVLAVMQEALNGLAAERRLPLAG